MNNIVPFNFNQNQVQVIIDEQGDPWWVASEICGVLGIVNSRDAVNNLDDDEKATVVIADTGNGGRDRRIIINEPGLYSLILRSRKPEAKLFKRWITHEVIPSIRKTGKYSVARTQVLPDFTNPPEAARAWAEQYERSQIAESKVIEMKPKVDGFNRISEADGATSITDAAKALQVQPQKVLFPWLQSNKWIYRRPGNHRWIAYQDKIQSGLLMHKVTVVTKSDGSEKTVEQVLVTPKGITEIASRL